VDVDVFTKEGFRSTNQADVIAWINNAHAEEKEHFFRLLTDQTIRELKEK
jgi:uncharacterized protein (TIGR04255 family)